MLDISPTDLVHAPVEDLVVGASRMPLLDETEEARLADRRTDHEALTELVRRHLRVAVDEAIRNRGLGARQDVLVRAGARALVEAAPRYDPEMHGAFSTYARRTVRDAIARAIGS